MVFTILMDSVSHKNVTYRFLIVSRSGMTRQTCSANLTWSPHVAQIPKFHDTTLGMDSTMYLQKSLPEPQDQVGGDLEFGNLYLL